MTQKTLTPFGLECKKLRLDKNLTLRQFANKIGFSSTYVCNMESGLREPTINYVNNVVKFCNLNQTQRIDLLSKWIDSVKEVRVNTNTLTRIQKYECLMQLLENA